MKKERRMTMKLGLSRASSLGLQVTSQMQNCTMDDKTKYFKSLLTRELLK
jgi:hypothetical protein